MAWLWIQSLVMIAAVFAGGLWLGKAMALITTGLMRPAPQQPSFALNEDGEVYPAYHGAEAVEEPVAPSLAPVAEAPAAVPAPPLPVTPPVRVKPRLLFPVNQFGVITVTQAPA
jgi:hypothetical protein